MRRGEEPRRVLTIMAIELPKLSIVDKVTAALRGKSHAVALTGAWGSSKRLVAAQAAEALAAPMLIVTAGRHESEAAFDDLATLFGEEACALFPAWEVLPTDSMSPADDIVAERMNTLKRMMTAFESDQPMYVVCPIRSVMQYVIEPKQLQKDTLTLRSGMEVDLGDFLEKLVKMGLKLNIPL